MGLLAYQLRHAVRQLPRAPGSSLAVVLTLALGIGASSAMFTVVKATLLGPVLYAEDEERVVIIGEGGKPRRTTIALANFLDWRERARSFSAIGVHRYHEVTLSTGDLALSLDGAILSSAAFEALGVRPLLGRAFLLEEDRLDAAPAVILREDLWREAFGGDPAILGRTVALDGVSHTVVGVMPRRFAFPRSTSRLWVPYGPFIARDPGIVNRDERRGFFALARLAPGVGLADARREMDAIARQLAVEHPATNAGTSVDLRSIRDEEVGDTRPMLLVLFGAVGLLLVVACANAVALLLARGLGRAREMAVRAALGASRRQLFTQLLCEALVLSALSGIVSFLVAAVGADAVLAVAPELPRLGAPGPDLRVAAFAFALSLVVGIGVGLVPALHAARSIAGRPPRAQSLVIVLQVALALILAAGAGVTMKNALRLHAREPGLDLDGVRVVRVRLAGDAYAADARRAEIARALVERLEAVPGVTSVGAAFPGPMTGLWGMGYATAPAAVGAPVPLLDHSPVSPGFFWTLGIPIVAGRGITAADGARAPRVVVLSVSAARQIFGDADAVGRTVRLGVPSQLVGAAFATAPVHTVVGVAGDVRARGLLRDSPGQIYVAMAQRPQATLRLYLQTALPPSSLAAAVREAVARVDPALAPGELQPLRDVVLESLADQRFTTLLFGLFAAMALFLAAMGIYGLVAFLVATRTREIGVRVALGARRRDVVELVLGRMAVLVAAGLGGGLAGTAALSQVMASLVSGMTALDPPILALVSGGFVLVAAAACVPPLRRALGVDPAIALRADP